MHLNYLEMKYLVLCVTLNLLFFANIVSSTVSIVAKYDDKATSTKKYEIKQAIQLLCNVTKDASEKVEVKWEKNGKPVTEISELKNRLSLSHNGDTYKLQLNSAEENDGGNYTCIAYVDASEVARAHITVESKIYVKIPRDLPVVEGKELRVVCQVHGNPIPYVVWEYKNTTYEESKGRVIIENEKAVQNAVFIIKESVPDDQAVLKCRGISRITNETSDPSKGTIRVKDKYAAVWPFIGICAEVAVLCAIILIYEKKRNKTELEESDTDQSPEQKNTPDHGGKESNLRHRQ